MKSLEIFSGRKLLAQDYLRFPAGGLANFSVCTFAFSRPHSHKGSVALNYSSVRHWRPGVKMTGRGGVRRGLQRLQGRTVEEGSFTMKTFFALTASLLVLTTAKAQGPCQVYRLEYGTVYDERQVNAFRVEYEDAFEERKVTSFRPVWDTEVRTQRRVVLKPVYETSEREEHYFVARPQWEEHIEDRSYDVTRNVVETAEREEKVYVNRPVWETHEREEHYTVRRPVVETAERDEVHTVMEPVTTFRPVQVDQGGFAEQQLYHPGPVRNRLTWQSGQCVVNPATGQTAYQRGGLFWQPVQKPGVVETQRVWIPNVVTTHVPQTTLMPRTEVRKVPVQVCRYVDEQMVRKVPVQVCRMVQQEEVRRVPFTVCKQVVEHVENKVPVRVCRMVNDEVVRKVPVTTTRYVQEEQVQEIPVRVCRQEQIEETVRVPVRVEKRVPVTYTYRVPRTVVYRVPIDPCGNSVYAGPPMAPGSAMPDSSQTFQQDKRKQEPTPAPPPGSRNNGSSTGDDDAGRQPELNPNENVPEAMNDETTSLAPVPARSKAGRQKVVRSKYMKET